MKQQVCRDSTSASCSSGHHGRFPALYPIINVDTSPDPLDSVKQLVVAGVGILQIRAKSWERERLRTFSNKLFSLKEDFARDDFPILILNDDVEVAAELPFDGAHIGQSDLPPRHAREILGMDKILGFSTHSRQQLEAALELPIDYVAVGPVFPTTSKANPDPVVGIELISYGAMLSTIPIVAIGGITVANAPLVYGAGATSVAVIRDLEAAASVEERVREYERTWVKFASPRTVRWRGT